MKEKILVHPKIQKNTIKFKNKQKHKTAQKSSRIKNFSRKINTIDGEKQEESKNNIKNNKKQKKKKSKNKKNAHNKQKKGKTRFGPSLQVLLGICFGRVSEHRSFLFQSLGASQKTSEAI